MTFSRIFLARSAALRFALSLFLYVGIGFAPAPAAADESGALKAALAAADARDWQKATDLSRGAGPVGGDIVEWLRLRAGEGQLGDYEVFLKRRADWPGLAFLRQKGESAVARSSTPARVTEYFTPAHPASAQGALALIRALTAAGKPAEAATEARRAWATLGFNAAQETELLALQGPALAGQHEARLDGLIWQGRAAEARRMLPLVSPGWRALATARLGLRDGAQGVNALISAVPKSLAGDAGLAHDRFQWRMDKGLYPDAAALIIERSSSAALLGDPARWAKRRASLARQLVDDGNAPLAYRVAVGHQLTSGGDFADLEFLAGFIALRKLGDTAGAKAHFARLKAVVTTPISLSRAFYWEGRAEEAAGRTNAARAAYTQAAKHQTAYYGLLAAEKLGQSLDSALLSEARPADWRGAGFARSSVLEAARLLVLAGDRGLAKRFFLHLAEGLGATELAQLADLALTLNEPHIAVLIGKQAAERGVILPRAYFPVVGMVPDGLAVSRALALSIARRESEFDPAVISPAGARGLMQVMPGTAKMMAQMTTQTYAQGRLTTDPAYNVTLGATYLGQLVAEFGPAVALVAAGYNAGPGRPRRWMTEFGDPRDPAVDVVDWVETIPYTETRTYVMRVVESLVIYRAKLRGSVGPVKLTSELTGR